MNRIVSNFAMATALGALLSGGVAAAQVTDSPAQDVGAEEGELALKSITVTAQRRTESLQDVPIAVTALPSDALEAMGVVDTESLSGAVPGLSFQKTANGGVPFIRGVGNSNVAVGDESAVAMYVDGVYIPSTIGTLFSLSNIAQVDVLKGPQGTLFGRNATGGVIQVTTRTPSEEPTLEVSVGYGSYDTVTASGYASTGLTENAAIDLAVFYENQGDGFGTDVSRGTDIYKGRDFAARSKLVWDATANTQVTFAGDFSKSTNNFPYALPPGSVALDGVTTFQGFRNASSSYPQVVSDELWGTSLTVEHDLGWAGLTSLSSYRHLDGFLSADNDATIVPILNASLVQAGKSFSQELRLTSADDAPFEWMAGVYFLDSTGGYSPILLGGFAVAPATFVSIDSEQQTVSYSAFGQTTFGLSDKLDMTLGLRYTEDEQTINYFQATDFGGAGGEASAKFSKLTPRISFDYQFTPQFMGYVSYNKGFKSGLFNTVTPTDPPVKPSTINAYEAGFKSEILGGRLRFNGSAFYYDQQDLQLLRVDGPLTIVVNAAESEVLGADVDFEWLVTRDLILRGGASYLDSEYTDYPNAPISTRNPLGGNVITPGDATGNEAVRAPSLQTTLGIVYTPTQNWSIGASYSYTDSFAWDPDNRLRQPSYSLVNANIGWTSDNGRLGVRGWVRNLLDEEYYAFQTAAVFGDISNPAPPATYGVTLTLKN